MYPVAPVTMIFMGPTLRPKPELGQDGMAAIDPWYGRMGTRPKMRPPGSRIRGVPGDRTHSSPDASRALRVQHSNRPERTRESEMPIAAKRRTEIRPELPADHDRVFEVVQAAFGSRLEADLVVALRRSADPQLSLVAVEEQDVVGHIFFSPVTLDPDRTAPPLTQLSPLAVEPQHQRRGVGSDLVGAGLEQCAARGWHAVFVVGDPAYYARFGFQKAGPLGFSLGTPLDPYLQLLELESGVLDGVRGRLHLHPAFAEVGAE